MSVLVYEDNHVQFFRCSYSAHERYRGLPTSDNSPFACGALGKNFRCTFRTPLDSSQSESDIRRPTANDSLFHLSHYKMLYQPPLMLTANEEIGRLERTIFLLIMMHQLLPSNYSNSTYLLFTTTSKLSPLQAISLTSSRGTSSRLHS